jgi:3-oxoacyl-[acyl-carrier protein] reductase
LSEWSGRTVLVTGGTRGIGRACAEAFAHVGAQVALCGRSVETAEEVAKGIADATGADVRGWACDMADRDAVDAMVKGVEEAFGPIYALVNNAGITRDGLILRMKDEDWNAVIAANLNGVFYCCRAVAKKMLKERVGRIINVSSIIGLHGQAGQSNYAAAKAGMIGFTKSLAQEFAARNVTANVVAPGYIETDMTSAFTDAQRETILNRVPLKRAGSSGDVANAVLFLASDAAAYITGHTLTVDGGLAM